MDVRKSFSYADSQSSEQGVGATRPGLCAGVSGAIPRLRGVLMRRRCDACGARIDFKGEAPDRVFMKCPRCEKEYVFFDQNRVPVV